MGNFVLALLLLAICLLGVAMRKIYFYLPPKELKHQAESGDALARSLWRAVSYDTSLQALLWLWIGLTAAGGFVLLTKDAPWPIAFIGIALLLWVSFAWFPQRTKVSGIEAKIASLLTPGIAWLLGHAHPILDHSLGHLVRHYSHDGHTNLFDNEDFVDLVKRQAHQTDSRISPAELQRVQQALTAHKYKVRDALTPRVNVKSVSDADTIGLVLLDELHASEQSAFPVVKGKTDKIVGALYLDDLNLKTEGKVRDYMQADVRYLHEDDSLTQALQAFFKTKQQLFVVVNSFEEYVGVLSLEQLMQHLIGKIPADSFDQHADLAAVANKHAHDDDEPELVEPEPEEAVIPESTEGITEPEPETELVTEESEDTSSPELESEADIEEDDQKPEPEEEASSEESADDFAAVEEIDDEPEPANPDELAALDLPDDDDEEELGEGSHVSFDKPKAKTPKTKKSEDEVVE